jgi:hypothetical protein
MNAADLKSREQEKAMQSRLRFLTFSILLLALGAGDARAQGIEGVRPARAQVEIFGGYSYMRSTTAGSGAPINLNGASVSMAFYLRNWVGLVGDVGVYHQGDVAASGYSLTVSSYQFGPRLRLRNHTHLTPFGQFLLGAGHAGGTLYTRSLGSGMPPLGANNGFLFTGGCGLDWKLSPRIGIRLLQVDYLHSQFLNGSGNGNQQDNLRLSTGVVFTFGDN